MKKLMTIAAFAAFAATAAIAQNPASPSPGLGKCAPWDTYVSSVRALFGGDEAVNVEFDRPAKTLTLYVAGDEKCDAIDALLPDTKDFGGYVLKIKTVHVNATLTARNPARLFEAAFSGNPAFSRVECLSSDFLTSIFVGPITFVEFENKVVQYWDDDISSLYGLRSTLFETLAGEVFDPAAVQGCIFSTAKPKEQN